MSITLELLNSERRIHRRSPMFLEGIKTLVVEDDPFIALDVCAALEGAGAEVVGPVSRVSDCVSVLAAGTVALAILDFKVADGTTHTVARSLAERHVPFFYYTASFEEARSSSLGRPIFSKPLQPDEIVAAAVAVLQEAGSFRDTAGRNC